MAKIQVIGNACVVTSALTLSDIEMVKRYRPKALTLYGGDDGKEPIFCISTGTQHGSINQYGAEFGSATRDGNGLATLTLAFEVDNDTTPEQLKALIADGVGSYVATLNKLEDRLPAVVEEIKAEREVILSNIEIC